MTTVVEVEMMQNAGMVALIPLAVRNLLALNGLKATYGTIVYQPERISGYRVMRAEPRTRLQAEQWVGCRLDKLCNIQAAQAIIYEWERQYAPRL